MTSGWKRAGGAGATVLALAVSGLLIPTAASAEDSTAPTSGPEFDALAQQMLAEDTDVQAVASDGKGGVVVYTTAAAEELEPAARSFVETNSNVTVRNLSAPLTSYADTDVVGGAGYYTAAPGATQGGLCSVGFSGWTPSGDPAVISAGHCTDDGVNTLSVLTLPTGDPAGGGASNNDDVEFTYALGELGFAQFGGPGNTTGTDGDTTSVDISVIDVLNPDLTLLPEITDWTTSESEDLSLSTTPVRSVGTAQVGGTIEKSGRTTGHTVGTVDSVNGWASVSGRIVYGFGSFLDSIEGDSGGAMYQGTTAVGVLSGGATLDDGRSFVWGADLQAGLALTGGYSVALFIDEPALVSPADGGNVGVGGTISGTGPANRTLVVTPDNEESFTAQIDGNGNWSFPAPSELGTYSFEMYATDGGYNRSTTVDATIDVLPTAPVITTPANGSKTETAVTQIAGTGEPGATVTIDGDVTDTAEVDEAGNWSVEADLGIGAYTITASQEVNDVDSADATSSFSVIPVAPVIGSPLNGVTYGADAAPTSATGTGIDGATVSVSVDGTEVGTAEVTDGKWTVPFDAPAANAAAALVANSTEFTALAALAGGNHTVTATQTVSGQTSNAASVSFTVAAAPAPPAPGTPGGTLPATGIDNPTPTVVAALAVLFAGVALIAYRRVRQTDKR